MEEEQGLVFHDVEGVPCSKEATTKLEMSVEEVIEEYVGSLGFSQIVHVFFVSLAWIFDSQNTLVTIFTDAQPSWTCKGGGTWCNNQGSTSSMCEIKAGTWEWSEGKRSSVITEWELVCDYKFLAGLPASLFFLGSLLGSVFYGHIADKHIGRKKAVLLSCLLSSLTSFLTSLSPNVWIYALLRFSNGFSRSGIGICCIVLATEAVGRKWRGQVGQCGFFFFTLGFMSLPLIAYPARTNWRSIYIVIALLPLLYSVTILPFVSESPRWLVVKGRTNEAMEVLNKLARLNGKKIPKNLILLIPSTSKEPNVATMSIWSTRWAAKRMIILMLAGFGVGFVYYGVQLNVENLDFNLYFTVALNALMEIPAVLIGSALLCFMDRRLLLTSSSYIAAVSCILCIFFSGMNKGGKRGSWPQLSAEAVGFMAISITFDVLYVYCIELFPTNVRSFAVSLLRQALMLGASLAPVLVVLGRVSASVSFLVFGGLATCSGLLMFWLPETRNAPLYETLEQQDQEEEPKHTLYDYEVELGKQ